MPGRPRGAAHRHQPIASYHQAFTMIVVGVHYLIHLTYYLDQQTTRVIPLIMMRLPGVAASIMAGQELMVPRWHTRVVNLVTQRRHTSSLY